MQIMVAMYVESIPNRGSPPAILLRHAWREGKKIRKRTLANLSDWPAAQIEALRKVLRGDTLVSPTDLFAVERSTPHGHVEAVLGTMRKLGLPALIASKPSRERELVLAKVAARHLKDGALVLYDASTSYYEGRTCPLARFGHDRDGKKLPVILYGLLTDEVGRPGAIEVYRGNTCDNTTLSH